MPSISTSQSISLLTNREKEIINLIIYEYSTKEIAQTLFIGTETVKSHRRQIMIKMDVKNVAGIVREAFFRRLVSIDHKAKVA